MTGNMEYEKSGDVYILKRLGVNKSKLNRSWSRI